MARDETTVALAAGLLFAFFKGVGIAALFVFHFLLTNILFAIVKPYPHAAAFMLFFAEAFLSFWITLVSGKIVQTVFIFATKKLFTPSQCKIITLFAIIPTIMEAAVFLLLTRPYERVPIMVVSALLTGFVVLDAIVAYFSVLLAHFMVKNSIKFL